MSALDDVRRALTAAYGTDGTFDGRTVNYLIKALKQDKQQAILRELKHAANDLGGRVHYGGPRARGLAFARDLLLGRATGVMPEPAARNRHMEIAARLREEPGTWQPIATYANRKSAAAIAWQIRNGKGSLRAYLPAGSFDTRTEPSPRGTQVLARYVGTARKDTSL